MYSIPFFTFDLSVVFIFLFLLSKFKQKTNKSITFSLQGRPGINGYKGEKGEPRVGSGFGYPVSINTIINTLA